MSILHKTYRLFRKQAHGIQLNTCRWNSTGRNGFVDELLSSKKALAKISTLKTRIGLQPDFPVNGLAQAMIDKTAVQNAALSNEKLWTVGKVFGDMYVLEKIKCLYPRLPEKGVQALHEGLLGSRALNRLGNSWGLEVQRWNEDLKQAYGKVLAKTTEPETTRMPGEVYKPDAMKRTILAILGAVHLEGGYKASKQFVDSHIFSRQLEPRTMLQILYPRRQLSRLCRRLKLKDPVYRVDAETGRKTREPVFIIGAYSGPFCLGQGQASSMDLAEQQAAYNAVLSYYIHSPPFEQFPSDTLQTSSAPFSPIPYISPGELVL
ncbi:ribosomal protein subunit L3 [Schizosaccharomyces cryophilus OY26]|uniref:Ribosomal protein subunit L3 n=1 Tax=Schizosaccharomyces cryophilus (strain OY26 / ATCC MYA-4695 / CBS 11777 / NBRC 106824 / NRRL Y48691) TaxID=653667 RepID=S9W0Z3_SCHCR|nr:ribosomal protein subunit L3 [Schizosaccharomyces cryophilus OY26]EPY53553.1 ribosomal protein subunit L3 [Schizosaccharomyces cryophilus OY26]